MKIGFLLILLLQAVEARHRLVAHWGQNGVYFRKKERKFWEEDLLTVCRKRKYDTVIIGFMNVFFDPQNKDQMPGLNFAFHCEQPISDEYPTLLRCPNIEAGIHACKKNGKRVLLNLGGSQGQYGFESLEEARLLAYRIWHLFLDGDKMKELRPFGTAILDGVDLDLNQGRPYGYSAFVGELHRLARGERKRKRISMSAAPGCLFPDFLVGPDRDKLLGEVPKLVDELYVQYRSEQCSTKDATRFYKSIDQWFSWSESIRGPSVYVGLPADIIHYDGDKEYRPFNELAQIYQILKKKPRFGGFTLWDVSFDQANVENGKTYGERIADMLRGGKPGKIKGYKSDLSDEQIVCDATGLSFEGRSADFPRYSGPEISLNTCPLDDDFYVRADVRKCNITVFSGGDSVMFIGTIVSAKPKGIITRRKPVRIGVRCIYNRRTQKTVVLDVPPMSAIGADQLVMASMGEPISLYVNLLDGRGGAVVSSGSSLPVEVGTIVYTAVGGDHLDALELNAYATDCHVTPNNDKQNTVRWQLIKDSCPVDDTVQIEESGRGQEISFESFSFTQDTKEEIIMHCDIIACAPNDGCGICTRSIIPYVRRRKRRSATPLISSSSSLPIRILI